MAYQAGRHFLQIPGPTNVPGPDLAGVIDNPTIDHRSADFLAGLGAACLEGMKAIFKDARGCDYLSGFGYRGVGGRTGEYAERGATGWSR